MIRLLFILSVVVVIASCASYTYTSQEQSFSEMYNPGKTVLHPEFKVQIKNDTTANLLVRVLRNELLFSRANHEGKLKSELEIHCKVYADLKENVLHDSLTVSREVLFSKNPVVISVVKLHIDTARWHHVQLRITDKFRQKSYYGYTIIDNRKHFGGQKLYTTLMPINTETATERLAFYPWVTDSSAVKLYVPSGVNKKGHVQIFWDKNKLPSRPYAEYADSLNYKADTMVYFSSGSFFPQDEGLYFFTDDTLHQSGVGMIKANPYFPEVRRTKDLIAGLEYLCEPKEFKALQHSTNYKLAVDEFWMKSAKDYNKAKQLIRIYYNRMRYANIYFSSVTEGWQTDRGMIFMLFGPPEKVYRRNFGERWLYGTSAQHRSLQFDFEYVENKFSSNAYRLKRRADYRSAWKYAVKTWRTGTVYNGDEKISTQVYQNSEQIQ